MRELAIVNLGMLAGPDEIRETYSVDVETGFDLEPDHSTSRRVHCAQVPTAFRRQRPVESDFPHFKPSAEPARLQFRTLYVPGKALYASDGSHDPITSRSVELFAL